MRLTSGLVLKWLFSIVWLVLTSLNSFAQLDNRSFYSLQPIDTLENKAFSIQLDHLNFMKNNEYFSKIADGYTLFGFQLIPKVIFQAHPKIRLEGGAFIRKDYGQNGFHQIEPIFTARYTNGNHQLLFGTLDGGLAHNLIEPMYDFENQILRRLEFGQQWKYKVNGLMVDVWVDWRKMIYDYSDVQEKVFGGFNIEKSIFTKEKTTLKLSAQATGFHKGGQIDTAYLPLTTWFHYAPGIKFRTITGSGGFLKSIDFDGYLVGFYDHSNQKQYPFKSSVSTYLNLTANFHGNSLMVSYWNGENFASYQGGRLYRSVSSAVHQPGLIEKNRELVIVRLLSDWEIGSGIYITARLEPYFDLRNKTWDFSHGLYFNYRGQLWRSNPAKSIN